jgi:hypothetical protein
LIVVVPSGFAQLKVIPERGRKVIRRKPKPIVVLFILPGVNTVR